jgi:hypothetical protein
VKRTILTTFGVFEEILLNRIFLVFLFSSSIFAENIYHKTVNKNIKYLKSGNQYSLYSEKLETDGTLLIRGNIQNPKKFGEENGLKFLRKSSTGTLVFKNLSQIEIIEKCNELQNLPEIEIAEPNWKRERKVK